MEATSPTPPTADPEEGRARISPAVALAVLEAIQAHDRPGEVLEAENLARTIPRRFGLNDVVLRQIERFEADARRRKRLTDGELRDLIRFVIRRPDSVEIFQEVGRTLARATVRPPRFRDILSSGWTLSAARRRVRRGLRSLFGRPIGAFAQEPFALEGRGLLFIRSDPGGHACEFVTSYCEEALLRCAGGATPVAHDLCEARGDPHCRWSVMAAAGAREPKASKGRLGLDAVGDPEPAGASARSGLTGGGTSPSRAH